MNVEKIVGDYCELDAMLCLHYYSNYVTLRIQGDDEEYRLDQIKEFENVQHPNWTEISDISGAYEEAGSRSLDKASSLLGSLCSDGGDGCPFCHGGHQRQCFYEGKWMPNGFSHRSVN